MSRFQLTPEQQCAVENTGGPLLVSAAAGSGKTRVLVERLLRRVMDDAACDVDDFLVITFTNAAAAELRSRILDELTERMADEPGNLRLRRQAELCGRAHFETIHSFCAGVIRENAQLAGVSPEFRVADDNEAKALQAETLSDVLETLYDSGDEAFRELADTMGAGRDDSQLEAIILDTYGKLMSHPYPERWMAQQLEQLAAERVTDAAETVWGRAILTRLQARAAYLERRTEALLERMAEEPPFQEKYGPDVEHILASLRRFRTAAETGWDRAREAAAFTYVGGRVAGYDDLKSERTAIKKEMDKFSETLYEPSEKLLADMAQVEPRIRALFGAVQAFAAGYAERKRRRGVLDFSDQEHMALAILVDGETGEPTDTARETAKRFREIMVDEYQDVNAIQELIFNAVSREGNNVFMVGDVKQSIYRFRLADPTIFLRKYGAFADAAEARDGEGRRVILSGNFRSRKGVVDAVNFLFSNVMSEEFGEMAYTEREALHAEAAYADNGEPCFELDVIDMHSDDEEGDDADKTATEAAFVAGRIRELVPAMRVSDGSGGLRPAAYGDVAVLLRSAKGKLGAYAAALTAAGIPVAVDTRADFFATVEISVTISLLAVIDNPHQDVPLVAVMRSPLFGFTADDLASIRAGCREGDLYDAVKKAAEQDARCRDFVDRLNAFREAAPDKSVGEFLGYIAEETGLFAAVSAMQGGARRRADLMLLLDYARNFEATGAKGLFSFVAYLRRLRDENEAVTAEAIPETVNAVRIMTVHRSKGMEFPIVFLADTAKLFNYEDNKKPLLIHKELGVGARFTDRKRRIEYPTLARRAIDQRLKDEMKAEELRVLYVAMTRAREKLIMTAAVANAEKTIAPLADGPLPVPPQRAADAKSMLEWVLLASLRRPDCAPLRFGADAIPAETEGEAWQVRLVKAADVTKTAAAAAELPAEEETVPLELAERFAYVYPYSGMEGVPSKVTATALNGSVKAAETAEDAEPALRKRVFEPVRPGFMEEVRRMTPAERGIATHTVMQYAELEACVTERGAAEEIERLRAMGTITDEQAKTVRPEVIAGFMNSDLGQRIRRADRVWRELKFSLLADSEQLGYPAGEKILLQGVVDCCIEEQGGLTVIDYKTDYVTRDMLAEKTAYYAGQLGAYAMALERMMGMPVREKHLYFLTAGLSAAV